MCCLSYEYDYYNDASKQLPKVGAEVGTPDGKATVASLNMLKMQVRVKQDDGAGGFVFKEFPVEEIKFKKPPVAQTQKDDEDDDIEE